MIGLFLIKFSFIQRFTYPYILLSRKIINLLPAQAVFTVVTGAGVLHAFQILFRVNTF